MWNNKIKNINTTLFSVDTNDIAFFNSISCPKAHEIDKIGNFSIDNKNYLIRDSSSGKDIVTTFNVSNKLNNLYTTWCPSAFSLVGGYFNTDTIGYDRLPLLNANNVSLESTTNMNLSFNAGSTINSIEINNFNYCFLLNNWLTYKNIFKPDYWNTSVSYSLTNLNFYYVRLIFNVQRTIKTTSYTFSVSKNYWINNSFSSFNNKILLYPGNIEYGDENEKTAYEYQHGYHNVCNTEYFLQGNISNNTLNFNILQHDFSRDAYGIHHETYKTINISDLPKYTLSMTTYGQNFTPIINYYKYELANFSILCISSPFYLNYKLEEEPHYDLQIITDKDNVETSPLIKINDSSLPSTEGDPHNQTYKVTTGDLLTVEPYLLNDVLIDNTEIYSSNTAINMFGLGNILYVRNAQMTDNIKYDWINMQMKTNFKKLITGNYVIHVNQTYSILQIQIIRSSTYDESEKSVKHEISFNNGNKKVQWDMGFDRIYSCLLPIKASLNIIGAFTITDYSTKEVLLTTTIFNDNDNPKTFNINILKHPKIIIEAN